MATAGQRIRRLLCVSLKDIPPQDQRSARCSFLESSLKALLSSQSARVKLPGRNVGPHLPPLLRWDAEREREREKKREREKALKLAARFALPPPAGHACPSPHSLDSASSEFCRRRQASQATSLVLAPVETVEQPPRAVACSYLRLRHKHG